MVRFFFYTLDQAGEVVATYDKFGILGRTLSLLKENDRFRQFDDEYADELDNNLKKIRYPFDRDLSFDFMCKNLND